MMQEDKPNHMRGALIGGAIMGILSAIPVVNCCCILYGFGGGWLAAHLASKTCRTFSLGEGAMSGLIAGVAGTVFYAVVSIPLTFILQSVLGDTSSMELPDDIPENVRQILEQMGDGTSAVSILMSVGFTAVILIGTGVVGGMIAGAIAGKKNEA